MKGSERNREVDNHGKNDRKMARETGKERETKGKRGVFVISSLSRGTSLHFDEFINSVKFWLKACHLMLL